MPEFTSQQLEVIKALTPIAQTLIAMFGFIIAIIQFRSSLKQRRDDQIWKQNEFVAAKFKEFYEEFQVANAIQILDWRKRKIGLWKNDPSKELIIDRPMLLSALSAKPKYTPDEAAIRDTFDSFFTRLGYFETYIIAGVIVEKQLKPYLIYWMDLLHGKKPGIMNAEAVEGIWSYLVLHDFNDTLALLLRFGDRPGVMVRTDVSKDILGSM